MIITENLELKGGDLAPGAAVEFDLRIPYRWVKVAQVNVVQLKPGAMHCIPEIWESTEARDAGYDRAFLYQLLYSRDIILEADEGGKYGEGLNPVAIYKDRNPGRDATHEDRTWNLHCRLTNLPTGTASDFAVSIKIAEIGERV